MALDYLGITQADLVNTRLFEFGLTIRNLYASAGAGVPGVAFPAGLTPCGLPVGLELGGAQGNDDAVLSIALAMEDALATIPAYSILATEG